MKSITKKTEKNELGQFGRRTVIGYKGSLNNNNIIDNNAISFC